jgi:carbon monoxide dehydrogenase subunit G
MRIEEQFEVASSPEVTFRELNNVGSIGYCIAGVQEVTVLNDDESRWKVQVRAGFMAITVDLHAKITDRQPGRRLAFAASGQDVELSGNVEFEPGSSGGTRCSIVIDADIGGPLGPLADVMAQGPQQQLVAETVRNIRERLPAVAEAGAAEQVSAAAVSPPPGRPSVSFAVPELRDGSLPTLLAGGALVLIGYLLGRHAHR